MPPRHYIVCALPCILAFPNLYEPMQPVCQFQPLPAPSLWLCRLSYPFEYDAKILIYWHILVFSGKYFYAVCKVLNIKHIHPPPERVRTQRGFASSRYYSKNYILIKFLNFLFFNYLINCFAFWYYIFSNFVGFDIYFLFFLFFV